MAERLDTDAPSLYLVCGAFAEAEAQVALNKILA